VVQRTTRKLVKVPLYGQPAGKVAKIHDGATVGATIGTDLFYSDGSIVTLENLRAALGISTSSGGGASSLPLARTLWRLIQEIPENVLEVAALNTVGLVVRQTAGTWTTRAIAVTSTDRLTIANGDGDAGAPTLDMADIAALSVWGRAANSIGKPAPIVAGANDRLLTRVADAVAFTQLTAGMFPATLNTTTALQVASLGVNIAAPATAGRVQADGATPEYRLSRSSGTASDWQAYLPAGSTDYRFFSGADRFIFAADGTQRVLGNALFVGESTFPSLTSTRGYLAANGSASATYLLRVGGVNQGYLFADATDFYIATPATQGNNLRLQTDDVDRIVIATGGTAITLTATIVAVSSKDFVVGNTAQLNATASRGNITVNGASTAIYQLATGGTRRAYIFHDGTELTIDNTQNGNLVLATQGVGYIAIDGAGVTIYSGVAVFRKNNAGVILRDTSGSATDMTAFLSLQDNGSVERGWIGFGNGNTQAAFVNSIGEIAITAATILALTATSSVIALTTPSRVQIASGGESIRNIQDGAYISFYNTANTLRRGYLQMVVGSHSYLVSEEAGRALWISSNGGGVLISDDNVGTAIGRFDTTTTASDTSLSIYCRANTNAIRLVVVGAADSGGAGFRLLRVLN
jgi:hypothetical protein